MPLLTAGARCYKKMFPQQIMETATSRRPLKSRDTGWARTLAAWLARRRVAPNAISVASALFAAGAAAALYFSGREGVPYRFLLLAAAIVGIQLRLLANLLDGMVAVEGGLKTKSGEVFNDLPDRIADALILIAAGYAVQGFPYGEALGWCAAMLAVFTAYVRMLGGAAGLPQSFIGPMAKQQRMAVMTVACLLSIFESRFLRPGSILWIALIVVNAGCVLTIARRTMKIVDGLESQ
jgi:phosphatidylglycerophosphate synthase